MAKPPSAAAAAARTAHIDAQLDGAEALEGTYPFTLARSVKSYRLNKFLHELIEPATARGFLCRPRSRCSSSSG